MHFPSKTLEKIYTIKTISKKYISEVFELLVNVFYSFSECYHALKTIIKLSTTCRFSTKFYTNLTRLLQYIYLDFRKNRTEMSVASLRNSDGFGKKGAMPLGFRESSPMVGVSFGVFKHLPRV